MRKKIKKRIVDYLKNNQINFLYINESNQPIDIASSDTLYIPAKNEDVLGGYVETTIRFKEKHFYCESYYCQPIIKNEGEATRACRIINYINKNVSYDCYTLYEHNWCIDEDEGDVFSGFLARYELAEMHFEETINHILNYSLQIVVDVCTPIILYIKEKISYEEAINYINNMKKERE